MDIVMLYMMLLLMAEILTGQQVYEQLGTGMVLLFVLYHTLNFIRIRNIIPRCGVRGQP